MNRNRNASLIVYLLGICLASGVSDKVYSSQDGPASFDRVIDMHVHTASIGAGGSGCFVNAALRDSYKFAWYLRAFGVSREELEAHGDAIIFERIAAHIRDSAAVGQAVVLAMDGVINADGMLDKQRTQVYVPNDFVRSEIAHHRDLLFGASVNPHRPDALSILDEVAAAGAVLVKWIPAIMAIDPSDRSIIPFYEKLVELKLPLLVHVGHERSFSGADDELGDPVRLKLALDIGVTVIAAHIGTTGKNEGEGNFERLLPLFEQHENLYADISSLTQINKLGYLQQALRVPGLSDRLLFGSDWPLQFFPLVSPWYQIGRVGIGKIRAVDKLENQWDRDVALKRAIGVPEDVFTRARAILKIP